MKVRVAVSLFLLAAPLFAQTDVPQCATSPANDARLQALHERVAMQQRLAPQAAAAAPELRDGAFYLAGDEQLVPGYRPFDLEGQSLTFTPSGAGYRIARGPLQYVDPSAAPLRDFQAAGSPYYVRYDSAVPLQLFGQSVNALYLSAYNGISLSVPQEQNAAQFDDLEAAVNREPLLSPLMITRRKPTRLHYPLLFVEPNGNTLVVTFRSATGRDFGYDVQVQLRADGSFTYSYRSMRNMRWGAAIVSAGFDPSSATRRTLAAWDDSRNDLSPGTFVPSLASVNDIARVEVARVNETDLVAVRLKIGAALDYKALADGQLLRYAVQIGAVAALLDVTKTGWTFTPFNAPLGIANGPEINIAGDVIEMYGIPIPSGTATTLNVVVWSLTSANRTIDFTSRSIPFDAAVKRISTDLSSFPNGTELALPIAEPFVLGELDPAAVWSRLQSSHALNGYDIDALAVYQSFFTDIIFYAGAYSTGGNPAVDCIAQPSNSRG